MRAVCYWVSLLRGRLNGPRRLGYRPRALTDSDPRIRRCGVMPLMAGSPGLSLPKGGGCSGGVAVRLYSGGDERCARGRGAHQRGLCTSLKVRRTRGEARGLSLTGVPKTRGVSIRKYCRGDGWARQGSATEGRTKFRSVDLHSQHDYMRLGCRSLL